MIEQWEALRTQQGTSAKSRMPRSLQRRGKDDISTNEHSYSGIRRLSYYPRLTRRPDAMLKCRHPGCGVIGFAYPACAARDRIKRLAQPLHVEDPRGSPFSCLASCVTSSRTFLRQQHIHHRVSTLIVFIGCLMVAGCTRAARIFGSSVVSHSQLCIGFISPRPLKPSRAFGLPFLRFELFRSTPAFSSSVSA